MRPLNAVSNARSASSDSAPSPPAPAMVLSQFTPSTRHVVLVISSTCRLCYNTCNLDAEVDAGPADSSVTVLHQAGMLLLLRLQPVPPLRILITTWARA
jgi:hypothetical protein